MDKFCLVNIQQTWNEAERKNKEDSIVLINQ